MSFDAESHRPEKNDELMADLLRSLTGDENLRQFVCAQLAKDDIEIQYPDIRDKDPEAYGLFCARAGIKEYLNLQELIENGTIYNGTNVDLEVALGRYADARKKFIGRDK